MGTPTFSLLATMIALASMAGQKEEVQAELKARWDPNPFEISTPTFKVQYDESFGEDRRIRVWTTVKIPEIELQVIQVLDKAGNVRSAKSIRTFIRSSAIWANAFEDRLFVYITHLHPGGQNPTMVFEIGPKAEIMESGVFLSEQESIERRKHANDPPKGFCIGP